MFHARNFSILNFEDKIRFFREKLNVLRSRSSVWRGMLLRRFERNAPADRSESLLLARIWENNDRASLDYVPRPYPGVITDFRPKKQYARYIESSLDWNELALGGQEIVTLPVYPAGMLLEPFVKHLAATLRTAIDKQIQMHEGPGR
jgi:hypothetical protein